MRDNLAFEEVGVNDAFSCCNAAFSARAPSDGAVLESAEIWAFGDVFVEDGDETNPDTTRCFIFGSSNTCNARQADGPWNVFTASDPGTGDPRPFLLLGNARCGQNVFGELLPPFDPEEGGTLRSASASPNRVGISAK